MTNIFNNEKNKKTFREILFFREALFLVPIISIFKFDSLEYIWFLLLFVFLHYLPLITLIIWRNKSKSVLSLFAPAMLFILFDASELFNIYIQNNFIISNVSLITGEQIKLISLICIYGSYVCSFLMGGFLAKKSEFWKKK